MAAPLTIDARRLAVGRRVSSSRRVLPAPLSLDVRREGADLIGVFEANNIEVTGAAWLHFLGVHETTAWRLLLFTPQADTKGTSWIYEKIFAYVSVLEHSISILPFDVIVGSPDEYDYRDLLEFAFDLSMKEETPVRAEWRGLKVDRAYVYRLRWPDTGSNRPRREAHTGKPDRTAARRDRIRGTARNTAGK